MAMCSLRYQESDFSLLSRNLDICRVCRAEGTSERPLFHPCVCTGSIKHIHQEWCVIRDIALCWYNDD